MIRQLRCDPEKNESVTRFWVLDSGWLERRLPFEGPGFHRSRVLMSAHHAASMAFCSRALSFLPRATVMQRDALRFIAGFSAGWSRDRAFVPLVGVVVFALLFGLSFAACLLKLLGVSFGSVACTASGSFPGASQGHFAQVAVFRRRFWLLNSQLFQQAVLHRVGSLPQLLNSLLVLAASAGAFPFLSLVNLRPLPG